MANVTYDIYRSSGLAADINKKAGSTVPYSFPEEFQLVLTLEGSDSAKLVREFEKNPLLRQQFIDKLNDKKSNSRKEYNALVERFADGIEALNALAAKGELEGAQSNFNNLYSAKSFEHNAKATIEAMEADAQSVWDHLKTTNSKYTAYKINLAVRFTLITGGVALNVGVNVAVIATSGFHFGAGLVLSAVGLWKSTTAMAQLMINSLKGVDRALKEAMEIFLSVSKKKERGWFGKTELLTEEIANSFATELLGLPAFFDTLSQAKEKVELARNKFNGSELRLHAFAKKIQRTAEKLDEIDEKLKILQKAGALETIPKKMRFNPAELAKTQDKMHKLLQKNWLKQEIFVLRKNVLEQLERDIAALAKHRTAGGTEVARKATVVVLKGLNIGLSLATMDFTSVTDVIAFGVDLGIQAVDAASEPITDAFANADIIKTKAGFKGSTDG